VFVGRQCKLLIIISRYFLTIEVNLSKKKFTFALIVADYVLHKHSSWRLKSFKSKSKHFNSTLQNYTGKIIIPLSRTIKFISSIMQIRRILKGLMAEIITSPTQIPVIFAANLIFWSLCAVVILKLLFISTVLGEAIKMYLMAEINFESFVCDFFLFYGNTTSAKLSKIVHSHSCYFVQSEKRSKQDFSLNQDFEVRKKSFIVWLSNATPTIRTTDITITIFLFHKCRQVSNYFS